VEILLLSYPFGKVSMVVLGLHKNSLILTLSKYHSVV
jgi:hypothetical protein